MGCVLWQDTSLSEYLSHPGVSTYEQTVRGVANGLSKMLSLGKFKPSLGISALKKSVLVSRISQKYDSLGVSDFENLDLGVSDFENVDIEISQMRRSIFYPQAYPKQEIKKFAPAGTR